MVLGTGSFIAFGNSFLLPQCFYFVCSHGFSGLVKIVFQAPFGHNDQVSADYARLSIGLSAQEIHR